MNFVSLPSPIYVGDPKALEQAIRSCSGAKRVAVDTETLGLSYHKLEDQVLYMGLSPNEQTRFLVPRKFLHYFKPLLLNEAIEKVFHNFKFDAHRLLNSGIHVKGPILDSAIMHSLIDTSAKHKLDLLSKEMFGVEMAAYKDIVGKNDPRNIAPGHERWEKFLDYGSLDALMTLKIGNFLERKLDVVDLFGDGDRSMLDYYWKYEYPQLMALFSMERVGVRIDVAKLEGWEKYYGELKDQKHGELCKLIGRPINPGSAIQLRELLYKTMRLSPIKFSDRTGEPSTDEATLKRLYSINQNPILKLILEYRAADKSRSTYAKGILKRSYEGRIHTNYNPFDVSTGRLSSSNPNLQNVQPKFREAFIPDEGKVFCGADYSQLELRITAHLSGEEAMITSFIEGLDMHLLNVAKQENRKYEEVVPIYKRAKQRIKEELPIEPNSEEEWILFARDGVKAIVYGLSYGAGARTVSESMAKAYKRPVTMDEAQEALDKYFNANRKVARMMQMLKNEARKNGYSTTLCGKRRHIPDIKSRIRYKQQAAMRQALNAPIQGTAADITKAALIRCFNDQKLKDLGVETLLQIHDELIFQVPLETKDSAAIRIKELMEDPFEGPQLAVPLEAKPSFGKHWGEIK